MPNPHADDTPAFTPAITALSFEDALRELETIVQQLERGQIKLDEAVSAYERGNALRAHCEARLNEARAKIEKISAAPGQAPVASPFDPA